MRILYIDCKNGVSGDMVYGALAQLLGEREAEVTAEIDELALHEEGESGHCHSSYSHIRGVIEGSKISEGAKEKALSIYSVIAGAEARVHETAVEDVHFHEVGRAAALKNIIGAAVCADALCADKVLCSEICDGEGFIECSHGTIPVPVPAVMAMRGNGNLVFVTDESVKTEMVTPSGLAILIGLGAAYGPRPSGGVILQMAVAFGKRETGRKGGLEAFLIEDAGEE